MNYVGSPHTNTSDELLSLEGNAPRTYGLDHMQPLEIDTISKI